MAQLDRKKTGCAIVFLLLFALPFFGVGCVMGYKSLRHLALASAARNWVETTAQIESVKLEAHHDSDGGATHKVVCTYTYEYRGETHTGNRVGLESGSDSITDWHKHTHNRLKQSRDRNESVTCYVNPKNPEESLLDRDIRWHLVLFYLAFVVTFGGFGSAAIIGVCYYFRNQRIKAGLKERYPDQPWMSNPKWHDNTIRPSRRIALLGIWGFAIFWNAIAIPLGVLFVPEYNEQGPVVLIAAIFPLIGLFLILAAVHMTLKLHKFRKSYLWLESIPGVVGGRLRGQLAIVGPTTAFDQINVTLRCMNTVTTRRGGESSSRQNVLWEKSKSFEAAAGTFGQTETQLPVDFQIPYSCLPTDDKDDTTVKWQLVAKAEVPGTDLDLTFDVPMYRTERSDPGIGETEEDLAERTSAEISPVSPLPRKLRLERDAYGQTIFVVSSWPGAGMALAVLVFGAVFTGVGVFMLTEWISGDRWSIPFVFGFGLIGPLILAVFTAFLGQTRTVIGRREVTVERRRPWGTRRQTIPRENIRSVKSKESASSSGTSGTTVYYAVSLALREGRDVKVAGMVKGDPARRWLISQLKAALELDDESSRSADDSGRMYRRYDGFDRE